MPSTRIELLAQQMDDAYVVLRARLRGTTDEEYFWEPVPDCWTVFQGPDGRWTYHYELPAPEPAPFTTLAWRVNHVALCKVMYHEHAFGPGELTWQTIETPASLAKALEVLERGQSLLTDDLARLSDDDEHHGAEIGCLRDLYLHGSGTSPKA